MTITTVIPKENHLLYVETDDGQAGLFDVSPYLDTEAFAPLRERAQFERVHNGRYFVEWECGADLSVDTIKARWRAVDNPVSERRA